MTFKTPISVPATLDNAPDIVDPAAARPVIAIHGGAGTIMRSAMSTDAERAYHAALADILLAGQRILAEGGSALDAVTEAVRLLEDCALFNAGHGAVFTASGTHELDASIMDGATLDAGSVCCVTTLKNPVLVARCVMEKSPHLMFTGPGAEAFAAQQGMEIVDPAYFWTESRHRQWLMARGTTGMVLDHDAATALAESVDPRDPLDPMKKFGTVGAVALDAAGHLAAATSTGGITNKQAGRVGDAPLIGAGCYASDDSCAVSTTGTGEMFIRMMAAYDVAAQMRYGGKTLEAASRDVVMDKLPRIDGRGGLIAVDADGNVVLPFNTEGMYRGYARVGEMPFTAIYGETL